MGARPFDWSDLEMFVATARGGTLAAAAKEMRVDAATVQRRMGKLEAAAGAKLFLRSPRGYALTEAGQDLFAHAQGMEEQAIAAWRKVGARDEQPMGTVRIATVDDFAVMVLPEIITSFRAKHPHITVSVDVRTSFVDLAKHQADVAFRFGSKPDVSDIVVRSSVRPRIHLYGTRAYLQKHGRPKTLEDLRRYDTVRFAIPSPPTERFLDRHTEPSRVALRSGSVFVIYGAVKAGAGIGFVPNFLVHGDKTFERLPFEAPELEAFARLWILVHVDLRQNARVRAFVEHAQQMLQAQRERFEG